MKDKQHGKEWQVAQGGRDIKLGRNNQETDSEESNLTSRWNMAGSMYNLDRVTKRDNIIKMERSETCDVVGEGYQSRATQSVLRETSSIELSIVQNSRSVALRALQLFWSRSIIA